MKFSMIQKGLQHECNKNEPHNKVILVIIRYFTQHIEESLNAMTQKRRKCQWEDIVFVNVKEILMLKMNQAY